MRRLFTIGCSYTSYGWPTWADWLGTQFDEYYNFGIAGAGNRYIGSTLGSILPQLNLTDEDVVIIQWGSLVRHDSFSYEGVWGNFCGNIYNQDLYPVEWVKKYFHPGQTAFETISYINFVKSFLKTTSCVWTMFWMLNPTIEEFLGEPFGLTSKYTPNPKKVEKVKVFLDRKKDILYKDFLDQDLSLFQLDFDAKMYHSGQFDSHPSPKAHLAYAKYICSKTLLEKYKSNLNKFDSLAAEWDKYKGDILTTDNKALEPEYPCKRHDISKWM